MVGEWRFGLRPAASPLHRAHDPVRVVLPAPLLPDTTVRHTAGVVRVKSGGWCDR